MLVYEKRIDDEKHLYGTMENVPSEDDEELIYKDADGAEVTPVAGDTYLDDGKGGIVRKSDKKQVNIFIGEEMIIPMNGDEPEPPVEPELVSIAMKTMPSRVEYQEGETLDLAGLVIEATFDDESTEEVTEGFTTTPENGVALTIDVTSVVVTYQEKTTDFAITVVPANVEEEQQEVEQ